VHARLRVGVIGAGAVLERFHMPAINGVPEVVRSIIIDADQERARRAAERFSFPRWSANIEDAFQACEIALVLVPNGKHAEVSGALLSEGVHVLCEKPMARTTEECEKMIRASERGRALLCIGHNRRFRSNIQLARQLLKKGLIGEITDVRVEEGSKSDWPRSASYFDSQIAGGGALLDVGIHSIDLTRWLAGDFEDLEYRGTEAKDGIESDAELQFRLSTGAIGRLAVSRSRELQQSMKFTGTKGSMDIGLWEPRISIRAARGKAFTNFPQLDAAVSRRPPLDSSFVDQLRNFVSAVKGEDSLLVSGQDGLAAVEVVCRAYRKEPSDSGVRAR
jgi:predicted dehydrogenase